MANRLPLLLLSLPICTVLASVSSAQDLSAAEVMQGKVRTPRTITFQVLLDSSPLEVFDMWTTVEGANSFFGTAARIDPRPGGLYEIEFGLRPDGEPAGPRQTRILKFEPGRELWFEWDVPQFAHELNTHPKPTWVEIRLEEYSENPARTLLYLDHLGFGEGELWERVYWFFESAWFDILYRLKSRIDATTHEP